ncbi:MAG: hypothetical protein HY036_00900 [Nitrospirae bacterium]|nr:hypothetical protein [Nitrospirota bacterium]
MSQPRSPNLLGQFVTAMYLRIGDWKGASNLRAPSVLLLSRGLYSLGQIATIRVMTELVKPAELGRFYYILSISSFIGLTLFNPMMFYVDRWCLKWWEERRIGEFLQSVVSYWVLAAFAAAGVLWAYQSIFPGKAPLSIPTLTMAVPLIVLAGTVTSVCISIINICYKSQFLVGFMLNLQVWANLAGVSAAVLLFTKDAEYLLLGQSISAVIVTVIACSILLRLGRVVTPPKKVERRMPVAWNEVWYFVWPMVLAQMLAWGQLQGLRVPLNATGGPAMVAIFSVLGGVAIGVFGVFEFVFTNLYIPRFWSQVHEKELDGTVITEFMRFQWPYLIIFVCWFLGASGFLLNIIVESQYRHYLGLVFLMAIGEMIRLAGHPFGYAIQADNKNKSFILPNGAAFLIGIGGTYFMGLVITPYLAAAIASITAFVIGILANIRTVRQKHQFQYPLYEMAISLALGILLLLPVLLMALIPDRHSVFVDVIVLGISIVMLIGTLLILPRVVQLFSLFYQPIRYRRGL